MCSVVGESVDLLSGWVGLAEPPPPSLKTDMLGEQETMNMWRHLQFYFQAHNHNKVHKEGS